jgi:hypothetical protein
LGAPRVPSLPVEHRGPGWLPGVVLPLPRSPRARGVGDVSRGARNRESTGLASTVAETAAALVPPRAVARRVCAGSAPARPCCLRLLLELPRKGCRDVLPHRLTYPFRVMGMSMWTSWVKLPSDIRVRTSRMCCVFKGRVVPSHSRATACLACDAMAFPFALSNVSACCRPDWSIREAPFTMKRG